MSDFLCTRFGEIIFDEKIGKKDSIENILTNKITALYRYEPKDIVDIWIICKNFNFNWYDIIEKSKQKEFGVDPIIISEIINTFPHFYHLWYSGCHYVSLLIMKKILIC